ncbi:enterochelin esterase-like enzyme [Mucilaginibacter gracilis]|uniref:Enterochelin esterase-like enzyme n=1 Tax=Mucilaginibacter gracilis TaxID=423350 RepID=A0A495IYJ5_9SPHI|nr:alpha/beta hydrolase-fold protein [Mucilaginibacter gracilis]RKR80899.1 enterochelin esterase-like enzyme [Mucilaginibacter gracilis]
MYPNLFVTEMAITEEILTLSSKVLGRDVTCTLLVPSEYNKAEAINLLLLNDGQEIENLQVKLTLLNLYNAHKIKPVLVAAIHAGDERLQEYGTAGQPDYKKRGSKAGQYTQFIIQELLPFLKQNTGINAFASTVFAGFSLGGLSAFDIAWNNADVFDKAGAFSGSFWWRSKGLDDGYHDGDRIMHHIISNTQAKPELKFWIQTGTADETADRNNNGIIDSIDDAIDLIGELELKGYTRPADIQYLEVVGGKHDMPTWAQAMPKFLSWAFKA